MVNDFGVIVEVHKPIAKDGFRLKVSVPALGMYFNGFRAYPSKLDGVEWGIYPPSQKNGLKYINLIEFDSKGALWQEIVKATSAAISSHQPIVKEPYSNSGGQDVTF